MAKQREGLLGQHQWKPKNPDANIPQIVRLARSCNNYVRPAFLTKSKSTSNVRRTAYLDGLRGFAALLVYWLHHQLWAHESLNGAAIMENAFGYKGQHYLSCLPFIRLFFTGGHFAVVVFFVLSGYVLSAKPLALIQSGDLLTLGDNISSALFRRWMRLNIPVICTTFLYMASWHFFRYRVEVEPKISFRDELWWWYCELKNFTFVWRTGGEMWLTYNFHAWSIPVEFKGSLTVYTVLMALSRFRRNARLICEVVLIIYFMYIADGWFCATFIAGMLICDLELLAAHRDLPDAVARLKPYKTIIFYALFAISLYLGGVPANTLDLQVLRDSPGWHYLSFLKPQAVFDYKWFYLFWAATFLVASVGHIPWLKSFFELPFNQYLGRVSFAFYLVHGPVLWVLGDRIYCAVGWSREGHAVSIPSWINMFPITKAGPLGLEISFLLPHLITLPVTLWTAEIATTLFDEPSVKLSQWLYTKMLSSPNKV